MMNVLMGRTPCEKKDIQRGGCWEETEGKKTAMHEPRSETWNRASLAVLEGTNLADTLI